jgi:hypothetical protein
MNKGTGLFITTESDFIMGKKYTPGKKGTITP